MVRGLVITAAITLTILGAAAAITVAAWLTNTTPKDSDAQAL